ncbi:PKD domain-containing protein [Methanosarcina siciliae]|uniref:PKD domain-containing protein n=1 Tax=Methanosarcina siciliae TaxID=38027 RepID=UPI000AFA7E5E|nr:PKD domain-containing protein [Methanosarcina siciliae]
MKRIFLILCIAALLCMTGLASAAVETVGPIANFTANTTSGPAPLTVQFTDISTNATSWAWDFENDGTIDSTDQNPVHTYSTEGIYTVNFTVSNAGGNASEVKTGYISVSEPLPSAPVANFSADITSGIGPLTVHFTDSSSGSPDTWEWDFDNDGNVDSTEQNPQFIYTDEGTYSVKLTVTSSAGNDSELKIDYITVVYPSPDFTANVTEGTVPLTVEFTGNISGLAPGYWNMWAWDVDGDGTYDYSPNFNITHTYTEPGTYDVIVKYDSWTLKKKAGYITVLPEIPVANFSADMTSGNAPLTVNFTDKSTGTVSSYSWDFENDGVVDSIEQNPSYTYASAGTYTVNLTVTNAAGSDSEVKINYITVEGTGTGGLADTPWPKFGYDLNNTGQSPYEGPHSGKVAWKYDAAGSFQYSGAVLGSDGTVYIGNYGNKALYAFNADGTLKWSYAAGSNVCGSPAIALDGTVYVGNRDKNLYAINADGTLKWTYATGNYIYGSPTIASDGTVYVGSLDGNLYALNPDGTEKWNYTTGGQFRYGCPAIASDGTVYVGNYDNSVYALNPNGTLKWSYATGGYIYGSPAIAPDGTVYVGSRDKNLYALNPNGTLKWSYATGGYIYGSPAIAPDGTVYAGSYDKSLYALNPNGTLKWNYATGGQFRYGSAVIGSDGLVYIGSGDNCLYAINSDGTLAWKYTTEGYAYYNTPAMGSDGTLYFGGYDNKLYAFRDVAPVAAFSGTPTGGNTPVTVQFTDESANAPTSWTWNFGDGNTSTVQNPDHTYTETGTYAVTLTVANSQGSDNKTKTDYITVSPPGVTAAVFSGTPTTGFVPMTVQFTDASTNAPTSWAWDFDNDGTIDSTDQNPSYTYNASGTYTVKLTASGPAGSSDKIETDYITSEPVNSVAETAWPKFHYDIKNTGQSPYNGSQNSNVAWEYTADGSLDFNSAVIGTDGTIYIGCSGTNKFYALNPDGTLKWTFSVGYSSETFEDSAALGMDGTIYTGNRNGNLYALNPDGTLKWSYATGDDIYHAPTIGPDGTVYVASFDRYLYAIDQEGSLKWRAQWQAALNTDVALGSPAIESDGTIYVGSTDGVLYAFNLDGTEKWNYTTGSPIYGSSAIGSDGTVYVGDNGGIVSALNPDGTLKWNCSVGYDYVGGFVNEPVRTTPAIGSDGTVYVSAMYGHLYAINASGTIQWSYATSSYVHGSPTIGADGTVYVVNNAGKVCAINPEGTLEWDSTLSSSGSRNSPAIGSDSTLYVTSGSTLYAIRPEVPVANFSAEPTSGDEPLTVNFTDESTKDPTSWLWDFGDGDDTNATMQNPVHTYNTAGTYTVTLTATNIAGNGTASKTGYITVLEAVIPVANFSAEPTSGDVPLTVNFTDESANNPTSWLWDFGDGDDTNATVQNPVHTYNAAGTYTVTLTAMNIAGNGTASKIGYITVVDAVAPVANFSANLTSGAVPLTVQFTDESANNPTSWLWNFGDGSTSDQQNPSHRYTFVGNYTVTLTATNAGGSGVEEKTEYITVTAGEMVELADSAWPKFGYDLNNTGQSPYAGPQSNNTVWTYTAGDKFYSGGSTIGPDGTIYIGNDDKNLYAFYPNGTLKWSYGADGKFSYSTPAIDSNGTVYIGNSDCKLYAINPDGTLKWSYATGGYVYSSPTIGPDGRIYVGSRDGCLHALYPDGTVMWTYAGGSYFYYGSPAIGPDGTIYAGNYDNKLYAVHPNGTLKWSYETGGTIYNAPAIATDGTVYVGSYDHNLYAINPDGTLRWNYTTGAQIYGAPAIAADGTVYIGSYDHNLYAINPDGTLKWTYEADNNFRYSQPVIGADGTVYIGDYSGKFYAISPEGTLKWDYTTGGRIYSSASIGSDGTLYVGSYDHKLYAFRDVAEFNAGPKGGGAPLTVRFTDLSTGDPTSWAWDFGDGDDTNATVQNPVHVYTEPGIYNVTLTVADAYHSYSTEKIGYINVTNDSSGVTAPIPSFTTDASSGRVPFTVQFTDTTTGNVSTWSWDFGDGETSDEQNPVHTYVTEGTHTVTLTTTGPGGTDTATAPITVNAPLTTGGGGFPLNTVQESNVSGGLWYDSYPGFETSAVKNFTLPAHTEIKWARLYADVYCGIMSGDYSGEVTIDIDADGDGTYERQEHETLSSTGLAWLNDHLNRVTSDYLMWYDLTDEIKGSGVNVSVSTAATHPNFDGRIKHITLVVAYDDGDEDEIHYWVNQGHDITNYGGYTGSTVFGTSALSDPGAVNLTSIYCASENGVYTFNGASLSSGGPQGAYFGYDDWNATEYFNSGQDSTLTYTNAGAYYKIQVALLTVSGAVSSNAPGADFTANVTSGVIPLTVSFTDESTGSPSSWLWDFGDGNNSMEQNPVYTYSTEGTYSINLTVTNEDGSDSELKTDYITVTQAGQVATNDLSISGLVNTVPASAVFARETNTVKVLNVQNTGTATLTNISIAVYASDVSSGTVPVNTTTIESLAGDAKTTVTLIDPTIRNLEGGTVTYTAVVDPDNLIAETDETNNNKSSAAKNVRYNGYKGKGIYWEGGSNITTRHTFDLQGNLLYSTQPDSAYQPVGWESRIETWNAGDLPVPDGSTIEKAFLYVAYNWDQTPGGYPWLNINFNGNTLDNGNISTGNGTLYRDWSNFGAYADYEYGLCVYDVTDKFSSAGNSLVMTPVGENKNALYPSTLVVIYGNDNETRKQIFINEECDELAYSETSYGTTPEEATAYAPFTGISINVSNVQNATLHSFAGSAGPDEGNLLFNGNIVASNAWQGSSNSGSSLVFDATNYINASGNEAGIQSTTSGGMNALQQILVVEYEKAAPAAPVADFSAAPSSGDIPLNVQFTDESTGSPTSWFWNFGDGANSTEQNPSHTYTAEGNYTVNLTVENAAGSDFESKSEYIEVSEASGSTVTLYFDPASSSVSENESTEISIVASNFPAGFSGYNLTVAFDDPTVAEIVDIEYPSWALITENSTLPGTSIYMKTVDLEDAVQEGAADVVLATLTVSGKEKGSANLSIGVKRLEEDSGDSIEPALLAGTIEVTLLSPLPDQEYAPKDLDGDGLYEDLTGNGEFSFVDIVAYFHNMDWIEENMQVEYFDFNGNGRIDFDDVVRMFAMI